MVLEHQSPNFVSWVQITFAVMDVYAYFCDGPAAKADHLHIVYLEDCFQRKSFHMRS